MPWLALNFLLLEWLQGAGRDWKLRRLQCLVDEWLRLLQMLELVRRLQRAHDTLRLIVCRERIITDRFVVCIAAERLDDARLFEWSHHEWLNFRLLGSLQLFFTLNSDRLKAQAARLQLEKLIVLLVLPSLDRFTLLRVALSCGRAQVLAVDPPQFQLLSTMLRVQVTLNRD